MATLWDEFVSGRPSGYAAGSCDSLDFSCVSRLSSASISLSPFELIVQEPMTWYKGFAYCAPLGSFLELSAVA